MLKIILIWVPAVIFFSLLGVYLYVQVNIVLMTRMSWNLIHPNHRVCSYHPYFSCQCPAPWPSSPWWSGSWSSLPTPLLDQSLEQRYCCFHFTTFVKNIIFLGGQWIRLRWASYPRTSWQNLVQLRPVPPILPAPHTYTAMWTNLTTHCPAADQSAREPTTVLPNSSSYLSCPNN